MAENQSNRLVGYARVSTQDQETNLQMDALHAAGVTHIYEEKASGATVERRRVLKRCLANMQPGQVLVVYKIDRIARSLTDLLAILDDLKARGASIRSLTEPLDTSTPMGMFVLQILGAVAQLERSIIRERSIAGQQAAKARGKHCGRPCSVDPQIAALIVAEYETHVTTLMAVARKYAVSESVVKRLVYKNRVILHKP